MHLVQSYSLQAGAKIDKIHVNEKFFPLPFENFVLVQPWSKNSKNWSFYEDCLALIAPLLEKAGLKLLQVGAKDERPLPNCHHVMGQTNYGQLEFLVSKAKLVLSADSICSHLAGHYNIPLVVLISNNYSNCVKPFFGDETKQVILEPDREKLKPTFSYDEPPIKQIDTISVEKVVNAICKLLNLPLDYPYKQLWMGFNHINFVWEMVPNNLVNLQSLGLNNIIVRMDFEHNEEILQRQLDLGNCAIVTNKPITLDILKKYKPRITELIYIIDETHVPNFVEEAQKIGLPRVILISKLGEDKLNPIKLYYMEMSPILPIPNIKKESIDEIKGVSELFYRTRKFTVSNGKVYPSKAAWKADKPMDLAQKNLFPIIDNEIFWEEVGHFALLTKE